MTASIHAAPDRRHLTPPPESPPPGYRYLTADEPVQVGDRAWDGCPEIWCCISDFAGVRAAKFICVARPARVARPTPRHAALG